MSSEGSGESARTRQSLHCLHTGGMDVDEGSDQNLDVKLNGICQHGSLFRPLDKSV